jgi:hypothetical protein
MQSITNIASTARAVATDKLFGAAGVRSMRLAEDSKPYRIMVVGRRCPHRAGMRECIDAAR